MKHTAYTLIELLVVISLLVVILLGGTTIFYQNLRSSGIANVELNLDSNLRSVLALIERDIRFSSVTQVGAGLREDCLAAASNGYTGTTLSTLDLQGLTTNYALVGVRVASTSAGMVDSVYLTDVSSEVTRLEFTWYCQSGISDKIKIEIDMKSAVLSAGIDVTRSVSREINLLNSGIN